tara:strand:- start:920 stop:1228 length:309 start_codon:yes stop_codon:yes gene_type:complete
MPEAYEDTDVGSGIIEELYSVIQDRQKEMPEDSYTTTLLQEGTNRIAQKVVEEAGETAIAAASGDVDHIPSEVADMIYHTLVLMADSGVKPSQIWEELRNRR